MVSGPLEFVFDGVDWRDRAVFLELCDSPRARLLEGAGAAVTASLAGALDFVLSGRLPKRSLWSQPLCGLLDSLRSVLDCEAVAAVRAADHPGFLAALHGGVLVCGWFVLRAPEGLEFALSLGVPSCSEVLGPAVDSVSPGPLLERLDFFESYLSGLRPVDQLQLRLRAGLLDMVSLCRVKADRVFLFLERGFAPPGYGMGAPEDLDDLLLELEDAVGAVDLMLVRGL